jgi:coenzyme F420-reducing hydrogenase alpha subunit
MKARMKDARRDALETVELFSKLDIPNFTRKCEHIAVSHPEEYGINEGRLVSTEGLNITAAEYREHILERQVPHSYAKHSSVKNKGSFLVGPLARVNNNFDRLSQGAKDALNSIGFKRPNYNPFMSLIARAAEILHIMEEGIEIIDRLPLKEETLSVEVKTGEGAAVTEAPRGVLYHRYKIDRRGLVEEADIVTPTAHNANNIERDLWEYIPAMKGLPLEKITLRCEMLIRAYDPCISCSVH